MIAVLNKQIHRTRYGLFVIIAFCLIAASTMVYADDRSDTIRLRAWGVPVKFGVGPIEAGERLMLQAFRERYPDIEPVAITTLTLPGNATQDMVPFMQIAGDLAPDVMYVNFRQSETYINMKLLHPLDRYVEALAEVTLPDGSALSNDGYMAALMGGHGWGRIERQVPQLCWPVMRRRCPYGQDCPYRSADGLAPLAAHSHIWTYPVGPLATAMQFDRTLLSEHAHEGVELRTPNDWEELLTWAKLMTDPATNTYGFQVATNAPAWTFANFLYAAGGNVVAQNEAGDWYCVLDSDEAVEAAYFWARLRLEKVERNGKFITRGVIKTGEATAGAEPVRTAFAYIYLDNRFFDSAIGSGIGAVPAGPTGLRRGEFNSKMLGIFAGTDDRHRDAAWKYIQFYDGDEARRIRTEKLVEAGSGPYVRRPLLEQFNDNGRYDSIIRRIPPGLEEIYTVAIDGGVPEPYGKNCQYVYDEMNKPLGAIWASASIQDAIDRGDASATKAEIRQILHRATQRINEKMLGNLSPAVAARQEKVAWAVIAAVALIFIVIFRLVFKAFTPPASHRPPLNESGHNYRQRRRRSIKAGLLMAPALGLIALWVYWPMLKGSELAFQDYSVLGDSRWVGAGNFAAVLFSPEFWYSLRVSLYYAVLFFFFGFWAPIGLALLLSEVPRGKVFFRTVFYLPAVLSGVVVLFLWKSFYGPEGMFNQWLNGIVGVLNHLPGISLGYFHEDWLQNPHFALFLCLLPTVWAGMGPGCLIYLAALKTIPAELYEAADIDGAGIRHKLFHIALPTIRILILINFIGAMIGAIRGSGGFVLAMTGGGPYGEQGGATEVIGLKIFYTTFGYLQFGMAAAMAWVLGAMLVGFTVLQLRRMANLEFRTVKEN